MIRRLTILALLTTTLALAAAHPAPKLIPESAADITTLLPPPPPMDSPEAQSELAVVRHTQQTATDSEKARAQSEKKLTIDAFTSVVGPWFTTENLPETAALFKQIETDSKFFSAAGKEHFKRPRPCDADPARITDITKEEEKEFSYPSGHSTRGTLFALVLAELFPDLKPQLLARSQQIGWDRIIAGVHYPSDITAGRTLAQALARSPANPTFKTELEKIRPELTRAQQNQKPLTTQTP